MKAFLRRNAPPIFILLGFGLLCLCLHLFVFHVVRIEGTSMESGLHSGDLVLVTRFDFAGSRAPQRGDVVECRFPGRSGVYIKRVIGLPGETVEIREGRTWIDGIPLSESYATGPAEDYRADLGADEYLVLGDNRAQSYDSRAEEMGFLHADNFLGRARVALWPLRRIK